MHLGGQEHSGLVIKMVANGRLVMMLAAGVGMLAGGCGTDENAGRVREAADPPLEIHTEPQVAVGVVEGDPIQEFERVRTPFLLADGRLVVPVGGQRVIRVFDSEGEHLETLGGPGEGPGEFRSLGAVWPRGDTIEAFDGDLRRITRFFPDGAIDVVALDANRAAQAAVPGALRDGWALVAVAEVGVNGRDQMVVHRFGLDGAYTGEVAQVGGMVRYSSSQVSGPGPLSPRAVFAVHEEEVYAAETLTPAIQVFDTTGSLIREIAWKPETSESPEMAFASVLDAVAARAGTNRGAATRQRLEGFPVPDRMSCFWDVIVDNLGFVWVRPYEAQWHSVYLGGAINGGAGPGGEWLVFSPEGVSVGSVKMPPTLEPTQITEDAVVGIERDEYGVEFVRVHSVVRR